MVTSKYVQLTRVLASLLWLALLFNSTLVFGQKSFSGLPFIRLYSNGDYQGGIQNWDIAQDSRGLIYVANNFGLLEYDGNAWKIYPVKNRTKVRSVAIDERGRIYVGCQAEFGYFFPNKRGELIYHSLADSLDAAARNFDEAWSVYLDNNTVHFCTFSRIYSFNQTDFSIATPTQGIDHSFFVNKQLFVNQTGIGLSILRDNTFSLLSGGEFFSSISVSGIVPLPGAGLLISTFQHGVFTLINGKTEPWRPALQSYFRESIVNSLLRLRNGNLALGTQNNGLIILSPEGKQLLQITRGQGFENRTVISLYEDDLNNLWVGLNNGLAYVELGSPFTFLNEEYGLPGSGYAAAMAGEQLILATNTGVYQYSNPKLFHLLPQTSGQAYHVGKYGDETMIGHHLGAMALRRDGNAVKRLSSEPGSWVFLNPKRNPNVLIEGTYAGLQRYENKNGAWQWTKKIPGFNESSRIMAEDEFGNFWITHGYKGAYRLKLSNELDAVEEVFYYGADKGFPSHLLINVFKIQNELLFTSERGVFRYDRTSDRFILDPMITRLLGPQVQVWFMDEDAFGNIYFLSDSHMGVLVRNAVGQYTLETQGFNKIRKYLNDDLYNISVLDNNEVLFGAKDGFIHYNPRMSTSRKGTFNTLIREVSTTDSLIFAGNYSSNDSIRLTQTADYVPELSYNSNSIQLRFAATAPEGSSEAMFQYMLEKEDKAWSDWTYENKKEYTNLREGSYVFRVRARNINGDISAPVSYTFRIAPPWYRSMVAFGLYGLGTVALLFSGFTLLDRKYQREQKILKQKQKDELIQKESELEKITIESQEEINRLQHEKLESELRHMNNELATSTMHLLTKNEFITSVKSNLDGLIKRSPDDLRRELLKISRDIENNISADADWEHFQWHFDRVHGDFTQRLKQSFPVLSPQDIKLSSYLRMNLSSKEIAQLLNISTRGVEISRYRLRKKLQLDRNQNLQDFILNY